MPARFGKTQFAAVDEKIPYPETFANPLAGAALSVVLNSQSEICLPSKPAVVLDVDAVKRPSFAGQGPACLKLVKSNCVQLAFNADKSLALAVRSNPGVKNPISATFPSGTGDPLKNTLRSIKPAS